MLRKLMFVLATIDYDFQVTSYSLDVPGAAVEVVAVQDSQVVYEQRDGGYGTPGEFIRTHHDTPQVILVSDGSSNYY